MNVFDGTNSNTAVSASGYTCMNSIMHHRYVCHRCHGVEVLNEMFL